MFDVLGSLESLWGLAALAVIAFCDTLIGVGFFVFGEVAFLAAGAAFAANGTVLPGMVVIVAAWAGDLTSYMIGRRFGARICLPVLRRRKRRLAWFRAKQALNSYGVLFVIVSRLLGPVAWVTPFLAGTLSMSPSTFALSAAIGVALGVGQFLFLGAVGHQLWILMEPHRSWVLPILTVAAISCVAGLVLWRLRERAV